MNGWRWSKSAEHALNAAAREDRREHTFYLVSAGVLLLVLVCLAVFVTYNAPRRPRVATLQCTMPFVLHFTTAGNVVHVTCTQEELRDDHTR